MLNQCELISNALSFGWGSCKKTAIVVQCGINVAETIIPGITKPEVQEVLGDPKNWEDVIEVIFSDIAGWFS